VFEDKSMADKVTVAVEKQIHYGDNIPDESEKAQAAHIEDKSEAKDKTIDLA
jgi:hypothetical protein